MSSTKTEYKHDSGADHVTKIVTTDVQTAEIYPHRPYRKLSVKTADGQLINNTTDAETVLIEVVDGLEVSRGVDPADATVLDYDGDATTTVDGSETTKTVTNGSVSFDVITEKPAPSTIEIVAESLADHPAESDSATIEVVSA